MSTPSGRRMAIDPGSVRVGVALTDPHRIIASPLVTLATDGAASAISEIARENEVSVIYVGLPLNLSGKEGSSAQFAIEFARTLSHVIDLPIRLLDERLTTSTASAIARSSGGRATKENIDQLAATELLEFALAQEKQRDDLAGVDLEAR